MKSSKSAAGKQRIKQSRQTKNRARTPQSPGLGAHQRQGAGGLGHDAIRADEEAEAPKLRVEDLSGSR